MLTTHLPVFAESGYPLGLEYAARIGATLGDFRVAEAAADGSGALYLLGYSNTSRYVVKVPPAGDTIQWKLPLQNPSGNHLAVGPDGSVFVSSFLSLPVDHAFVEKIRADGMGIATRLDLGAGLSINALTVDPSGRAWIAGHTQSHALIPTPNALQTTLRNTEFSHGFVVRLNAAGTALEYATYLGGSGADIAFGIAVDTSGSAFVAGWTTSMDFPFSPPLLNAPAVVSNGSGFLARIAPNGSQLMYSVPTGGPDGTLGYGASPVALDSDGNATIFGSTHRLIKRFSPDGKLTYSKTLPSLSDSLAVDSAGNTYVTGISTAANLPMKNVLAPCGTAYLMVFSPAGDLRQSTWIDGASGAFASSTVVVPDPRGAIYVLGAAETSYAGTRTVESPPGPLLLARFSPSPSKPLSLVCAGNAATLQAGAVSPGELVTLFGSGLGPAQASLAKWTSTGSLPIQWADVSVSFGGRPAPLVYVQDSQINAIVPWSTPTGTATDVCVTYKNTQTNCIPVGVVPPSAGLFLAPDGYSAALNEDGSINSADNPSSPGSVVALFGTGFGPITPAQPDGSTIGLPLPSNELPVTAAYWTGGVIGPIPNPLTVTYAGPAPFQVAGVTQINVQGSSGCLYVGQTRANCVPFKVH